MVFFERKPTPPPRATHFDLATERGNVAIALRRHPRARNYTLRVGSAAGSPVLTMPARGSLAEARAFLDRHAGWLRQPDGQAAAGRADRRRRHRAASRRALTASATSRWRAAR